jgi:hypothetical protein
LVLLLSENPSPVQKQATTPSRQRGDFAFFGSAPNWSMFPQSGDFSRKNVVFFGFYSTFSVMDTVVTVISATLNDSTFMYACTK